MRLKLASAILSDAGQPRLTDDAPLPPDDRVVATAPSAFEALYRAQAPRLLRFFARRSPASDVEDLVSESFLRLAPALEAGRVDNPEGYLHEVAKNVLRARARAAFHRAIVASVDDIDTHPAPVDPIAALEARETLARMQRTLDKLPAKTRAIFVAHRLHGLSYAEIALDQGLSMKGVEWHMSKAIAQLAHTARRK
jgi:RNA polymerase sigma factor (sigma-70 family)